MVALKVNFLEYRDPGLTGSPPHFNQYYFNSDINSNILHPPIKKNIRKNPYIPAMQLYLFLREEAGSPSGFL